jgi:hypothetical protein
MLPSVRPINDPSARSSLQAKRSNMVLHKTGEMRCDVRHERL